VVEVFQTGSCYLSGHADTDPEELGVATSSFGLPSRIIVPLRRAGRRLGVLSAASPWPEAFAAADSWILEGISACISRLVQPATPAAPWSSQVAAPRRYAEPTALLSRLTRRQLEVAQLVAAGFTNDQIAERLVLTSGSVANHIAAILHGLGMSSRTQVATLVVQTVDHPVLPASSGFHRDYTWAS